MGLAGPPIDYHYFRRQYQPEQISLIVIAESPPKSERYLYKPDGLISEPLFAALLKQLKCRPRTKAEGLAEMKAAGWLLVDATYTPVNKMSNKERCAVIVSDYPKLAADLRKLKACRVPIILMKVNVCRLLEPLLKPDGFNVINDGVDVPFPATGHQRRFAEAFSKLVRRAGLINDEPANPVLVGP